MRKGFRFIRANKKSGISLIFLLGIMTLLMIIGASVLTAASKNIAAGINARTGNQMNLTINSLQKSIKHNLQSEVDSGKNILGASALGGQIIREAYTQALANGTRIYNREFSFTVPITLSDGTTLPSIKSVTMTVTMSVNITSAQDKEDAVYARDGEGNKLLDEYGDPIVITPETARRPQSADIDGAVFFTIEAELGGKSTISAVTYSLLDAYLEDDGDSANNMMLVNCGEWRFEALEKVDK